VLINSPARQVLYDSGHIRQLLESEILRIAPVALDVSPSVAVWGLFMKLPEAIEIAALDAVEIAVEPWTWPFAQARRADINRHFAAQQRERPALWNGRVLLLHRYARENRVLRGASFETDYASFLAWRDWGCPAVGVFNIFAAAALQSADGAFLLGQMAPFTSAPGQWVFPCGTLDPNDISSSGMLDLVGSLGRELFEETGLDIDVCQVEPGWTLVRDGGFVALMKRVMVNASAEQLRANIVQHLANEAQPEFTAVRIVRRLTDVDPDTPRFYVHYLMGEWL
jgi:8-oxo-dGTP pyrophosphatase MutT (NUDIX family)